jgi:4-carboxymuconolactone decarboxylase
MNEDQTLHAKEQSIVTIAAFTAKGDLEQLRKALNKGLDAELTVNEIKEVLVQLYAYCGFPRSLNGINTLISVLRERKEKGVKDETGREATPVKDVGGKYERGKKVLETLTGRVESGPVTGFAAFSPEIDVFLKEHLFADIFERDILSYQAREITTISALISLGGVESQLQAHMNIGLHVGLVKAQLEQILSIIESDVGKKEAVAGRRVLAEVTASKER